VIAAEDCALRVAASDRDRLAFTLDLFKGINVIGLGSVRSGVAITDTQGEPSDGTMQGNIESAKVFV
jgi:hypothetical protein